MNVSTKDPFRLMWRWGVAITATGLILSVIGIINWLVAGSVASANFLWLAYVGFPVAFTGAAAALFGLVARYGGTTAPPPRDEAIGHERE